MKQLMLYDTMSCLNCFACMSACSVENRMRMERDQGIHLVKALNDFLPASYYLTPVKQEIGDYPDSRVIVGFHHCRHCEYAPCLESCPAGAIERRDGGQVVINPSACIGCRTCSDACPFDVPFYDRRTGKASKCIGCFDRVESGRKQSCVSACLTKSLISGSEAEIIAEGERRIASYQKRVGGEYLLYGKSSLNNYVGKTGWLTLAPKEFAEAYLLPENPIKLTMYLGNKSKLAGAAGLAGIGAGIALHTFYWLSKRKEKIQEENNGN